MKAIRRDERGAQMVELAAALLAIGMVLMTAVPNLVMRFEDHGINSITVAQDPIGCNQASQLSGRECY